jgi:hypothetical protein
MLQLDLQPTAYSRSLLPMLQLDLQPTAYSLQPVAHVAAMPQHALLLKPPDAGLVSANAAGYLEGNRDVHQQ